MPTDPETQRLFFTEGTRLLGGERAAARDLGINERTVRRLLAGESAIHDGFLKDMAAALQLHAAKCRELEKRINPLFTDNLVEDQRAADGRYKNNSVRFTHNTIKVDGIEITVPIEGED